MPANMTLKNIPDAIYARLKSVAEVNHRSINSEAIHCLERSLLPHRIEPGERLARARELRKLVSGPHVTSAGIAKAIRRGRP